jgi:hypothetical protein
MDRLADLACGLLAKVEVEAAYRDGIEAYILLKIGMLTGEDHFLAQTLLCPERPDHGRHLDRFGARSDDRDDQRPSTVPLISRHLARRVPQPPD